MSGPGHGGALGNACQHLLQHVVANTLLSAGFQLVEPVGAARVERAGETPNNDAAEEAEDSAAKDTGTAAGKDGASAKASVSDVGAGNAAWTDGCALIVEATESFLAGLIRNSKMLSELSGRTEVCLPDVVDAIEYRGRGGAADLVTYLQKFKNHQAKEDLAAVPTRQPKRKPDMSEVMDVDSSDSKVYDESHRQLRPSHVPEHLPRFPEPHSYMRTAVYYPPPTDFLVHQRKRAKANREMQESLSMLAAGMTTPAPVPIEFKRKASVRSKSKFKAGIQQDTQGTIPLLSRPRRGTNYLTWHVGEFDRPLGEPSAEFQAKRDINPFLQALDEYDPFYVASAKIVPGPPKFEPEPTVAASLAASEVDAASAIGGFDGTMSEQMSVGSPSSTATGQY